MGSSTVGFRLDDEIITELEDAASEASISKSELLREAVLRGLEEMKDEAGGIDVPEHLGHDAAVRRLIARNKKTRRSGKFRSEFAGQMKKSFKNNEHPEEFKRSVAGYLEEAEEMGELPEPVAEETGCDTFEEWVQDKLEYYAAAYEASTFEGDPIENPLGEFSGVSDAREWIDRAEAIANADNDARGGRKATEKRKKMAQHAISDGVVPDGINTPEEVIEAASEVVDMTRALEGGDQ